MVVNLVSAEHVKCYSTLLMKLVYIEFSGGSVADGTDVLILLMYQWTESMADVVSRGQPLS